MKLIDEVGIEQFQPICNEALRTNMITKGWENNLILPIDISKTGEIIAQMVLSSATFKVYRYTINIVSKEK